MPSKKPTKLELGIPSIKQQSNLKDIKNLARISQANRIIGAASREERRVTTKGTQTEPESFIEAEVVDSSDSEPEQEIGLTAEVVSVQEDAFSVGPSFWIVTGILLAIWIRLLQ
jgi:hypothetical protein